MEVARGLVPFDPACLAWLVLNDPRRQMLNRIHDQGEKVPEWPGIDPGIVDSKRLQMFFVAAKEESFAAAAQLLGVSPSAISHAIRALEEELGCSLFRRAGPQVKPTGAGVRLMPMVGDLLNRMASMKSELAALDGRSERLVLAIAAGLQPLLQTAVLSSFRECFPAAAFEVLIRDSGQLAADRSEPNFQIDYLEEVPVDAVRRDLFREELGLYAAPFHPLGQKGRISPVDLRNHLVILPDRAAYELIMGPRRGGDGDARTWILTSATSAREFVVQGQGLAFLPEWAVGTVLREGRLVRLNVPSLELSRTCCAWWSGRTPLTWIAEVFLSLLASDLDRQAESVAEEGEAVR